MKSWKSTRWIEFVGGKNLVFTLIVLILGALAIYLLNMISFIFDPLRVIIATIIGPVLLSLVLYYLFNPLVNWLEKHRIKRLYSVLGIFILILAALVLGVILVVPVISDQIESLIKNMPDYVEEINHTVTAFFKETAFADQLNEALTKVEDWMQSISDSLIDYLGKAMQGASAVFSTITSIALVLVTAPIMTFFLLKDDQKFFSFLLEIIPPRFRQDAKEIGATMNTQVGAYLKGQILVSIVIGLLTFVGFKIVGMPYSGILSIVVGITAIIPYIGPFVAFVPALIVAFMVSWVMVLKMCIVWVVVQMLNGHLIEPAVMGKHLMIHPLTIVIVLLVMGDLMGIFGLIFAIPIYAIIKVITIYLFRKFKNRYNRYYGEEGKYEETHFSKDDYLDGK